MIPINSIYEIGHTDVNILFLLLSSHVSLRSEIIQSCQGFLMSQSENRMSWGRDTPSAPHFPEAGDNMLILHSCFVKPWLLSLTRQTTFQGLVHFQSTRNSLFHAKSTCGYKTCLKKASQKAQRICCTYNTKLYSKWRSKNPLNASSSQAHCTCGLFSGI
jgi:hypothetical protein